MEVQYQYDYLQPCNIFTIRGISVLFRRCPFTTRAARAGDPPWRATWRRIALLKQHAERSLAHVSLDSQEPRGRVECIERRDASRRGSDGTTDDAWGVDEAHRRICALAEPGARGSAGR